MEIFDSKIFFTLMNETDSTLSDGICSSYPARRPSNLTIKMKDYFSEKSENEAMARARTRSSILIQVLKNDHLDIDSDERHGCLSIRNALSLVHTSIILISILMCFLVSYLASSGIASSAVKSMGLLTMQNIQTRLGELFGNVEKAAFSVESTIRLGLLDSHDMDESLRYLLYVYGSQSSFSNNMDQIYFAGNDQYFYGVGKLRNSSDTADRVLKYMSPQTSPKRRQISVGTNCSALNDYCAAFAISHDFEDVAKSLNGTVSTISNDYNVSSRPFFLNAISYKKAGWTDIYSFASDNSLGITYYIPVLGNNRNTVAAVDVTLKSLSFMLKSIVDNLYTLSPMVSGDGALIWIMDADDLKVIASSSYPNSVEPVNIGKFRDLQVIDRKDNLLMVDSFKMGENKTWTIVMQVPVNVFIHLLDQAYQLSIPVVTVSALVFSLCVSFMISRWIARPLETISQQMLKIANIEVCESSEHTREFETKSLLKEIRYIQVAMIKMRNGIIALSKYAPIEVVQIQMRLGLEAKLGVEEREMTVCKSVATSG